MQRMLMPSIGVKEGRVLCWLRHEGDLVKKYEPLLEVETDKINVLVEATASGVLRQLLVREGEIVSVGTPRACIDELNEPLSDLTLQQDELNRVSIEVDKNRMSYPPRPQIDADD